MRRKVGNLGLVLLGGAILSLSGFLSVYSIGIGFHFVTALIQGTSFSVLFCFGVLLKTFATATTLSFGGSGGLFFPTIVIGAD
jgi:CIC family chloride channel protein